MTTAAGPDASDNGLSFYLDAGNYRSYPGSGTSWFDLSGNSNTGTLTNGPTYSAVFGGSIVFDGVDDYISVPDSATTNFTTEESFSIWFYQTSTTVSWAGLVGKGSTDANEQYCLLLNADRQNLYWDIGQGSGPYVQPVLSSAYKLNTWHNIVATHIRTAGSSTLKIYFNGNLISASTISPTQGPNTSASPLTIGGSRVGGANFFFPGHISQVQLFNRELNATEILQNYLATKVRFAIPPIVTDNLILNLDAGNNSSYSGSGTTWTDLTPNGNNATLTNGPTYSATNAGNIVFDRVDDYAVLPFTTILYDCTFNFWFKATSTASYQYLLSLGNTSNSTYSLHFDMNDPDLGITGQTMWVYWNSGGTPYSVLSRSGTYGDFQDSTWRNYCFVRNNSDASVTRHYVNGVERTSGVTRAGSQTTQFGNGAGYYIKLATFHTNANFWAGGIAIVQIYTRALSAAEIYQNFNAYRSRFGV